MALLIAHEAAAPVYHLPCQAATSNVYLMPIAAALKAYEICAPAVPGLTPLPSRQAHPYSRCRVNQSC